MLGSTIKDSFSPQSNVLTSKASAGKTITGFYIFIGFGPR